jgi:hypothetical protein
MYPKQIIGTINALFKLTESVIAPIRTGTTDPPTIMVLIIPDAIGISEGSRSLTPSEKMLGNMMELKNPTERRHHIPIWGGSKMPQSTRIILAAPKIPSDMLAMPFPRYISPKFKRAIPKKMKP